jgi:protein SCO1/2
MLLLCLGLALAGPAAAAGEPPRVVASIKPLHSLLAGLMEGLAEPALLVSGERLPWDYRPDAGDLGTLRAADIVVWSGLELEPALAAPVAALDPDTRVYEVLASDALKVLPARHAAGDADPMYWLDSRNMLILLDEFTEMLSERDPARSLVYRRNRQAMAEALTAIDRTMEFRYRDVSGVPVFSYHDTQQYFEQAYAMRVAATVAAPRAGIETARLLEMRQAMAGMDRTCLFTERSLDEPHLELLLDRAGVQVVELDSFGTVLVPGPALYGELVQRNFKAISDCVRDLKPASRQAGYDPLTPDMGQSPAEFTPRFAMLDQHGRRVTSEDFAGSLQLIYFGYTYCPDICPTSLAVMSQALRQLGDEAAQIQPIFITVDPARDTPEMLAEYTGYFHPRMLGLWASPEATKRTAELFRARYEFVPAGDGDPRRYTVDHTASLFVLGRRGEYLTKFAHGLPAAEVAARLRELLRG